MVERLSTDGARIEGVGERAPITGPVSASLRRDYTPYTIQYGQGGPRTVQEVVDPDCFLFVNSQSLRGYDNWLHIAFQ